MNTDFVTTLYKAITKTSLYFCGGNARRYTQVIRSKVVWNSTLARAGVTSNAGQKSALCLAFLVRALNVRKPISKPATAITKDSSAKFAFVRDTTAKQSAIKVKKKSGGKERRGRREEWNGRRGINRHQWTRKKAKDKQDWKKKRNGRKKISRNCFRETRVAQKCALQGRAGQRTLWLKTGRINGRKRMCRKRLREDEGAKDVSRGKGVPKAAVREVCPVFVLFSCRLLYFYKTTTV